MTKFEVVNNLVKVISPSINSVSSQYCMLLGCVYRQTPLSYEYLKVNQLGICLAFASGLVSGFSGLQRNCSVYIHSLGISLQWEGSR